MVMKAEKRHARKTNYFGLAIYSGSTLPAAQSILEPVLRAASIVAYPDAQHKIQRVLGVVPRPLASGV